MNTALMLVKIIDILLGISVLAAAVLMAFAIYKLYNDDPSSTKYFISAVLAIIFALNFNDILNCLLPSKSMPYYGIIYIASAIFMALAVLYLSMGKIERGVSILKALTILVLVMTIFPLFVHTGLPLKVGAIPVTVDSPSLISSGSKATIKVKIQDAYAKGWKYTINFGDNTTQTKISTSREVTFVHEYTVKNGSTSTSYPITVTVQRVDNPSWWGVGYSQVTVKKVGFFSGLFLTVQSGVLNAWKSLISSLTLPVNMMYMAPLLVPGSPAYKLYRYFMGVALGIFMLMLFFGIASRVLTSEDPDLAIYETLKDAAIVLLMIVVSPVVYNLFANIFNTIGMHLIKYVNLGVVYASVAGAITLGLIVGTVQQYVAGVASAITIASAVTVAIAYVRYALLATLAAMIPLMAVLAVSGIFKKVVQHYINLMLVLLLSGPLIAAILAIVTFYTESVVGHGPLAALAYIPASFVTMLAAPMLIQTAITHNPAFGGAALANLATEGLVGSFGTFSSWGSSRFGGASSPPGPGTGPGSGPGGGSGTGGAGGAGGAPGTGPGGGSSLASNEIPEGPPEVQTIGASVHNISEAVQGRESPLPESLMALSGAGAGAERAQNQPSLPEQPNAPEEMPEIPPENVPEPRPEHGGAPGGGPDNVPEQPAQAAQPASQPGGEIPDQRSEQSTGRLDAVRSRIAPVYNKIAPVARKLRRNVITFSEHMHTSTLYYHHLFNRVAHPRAMKDRLYSAGEGSQVTMPSMRSAMGQDDTTTMATNVLPDDDTGGLGGMSE